MKCAIIAPIPLLNTYADLGDKYHLVLGHLIKSEPKYKEFYLESALRGDFIILDNSAHEFGVGSDIDDLITMANDIDASEIVLPDRLFFGDDTLYYAQQAYPKVRQQLPNISIMGVPQGRTSEEYFECLRGLSNLGVDTIGISKDYEAWPGGIRGILNFVTTFYPHLDVHLLGWGRDLEALYRIGKLYGNKVRGTDSAKPLQYAACGIYLDMDPNMPIPQYPRRALNFFNLEFKDIDFTCALNNIEVFEHWAKGL